MVAPWLGAVRPYRLDSLSRCQPDALPALTSVEYAEAYTEVKDVGSRERAPCVPPSRDTSRGRISGNFGGQFNRLMRELAAAYLGGSDVASLGNRARLFAIVNTSAADSFICSWNAKKAFNFWRPDRAIQRGDTDGNFMTDPDPAWTPYMATPNYR